MFSATMNNIDTLNENVSKGMINVNVRDPTPDDYVKANTKPSDAQTGDGEIEQNPLDDVETAKLLSRAKDISEKSDDQKDFFKRDSSNPTPKTGEVIEKSFPPSSAEPKPKQLQQEEEENKKELKVIRMTPSGKGLKVVPHITITFNQPMIPVTGVDDIKNLNVPVKIEPKMEGEWRWIGVSTLKWKPKHRVLKATDIVVVVPKDMKSEYGCSLKEDAKFEFSTVPLQINRIFPSYKKIGEDGIIFLEFNQKIDKKKVLEHLSIESEKSTKKFCLTLVSPEDVKKTIDSGDMKKKLRNFYDSYMRLIESERKDNIMFIKAKEKLELSQKYEIILKAGSLGGEGSLCTKDPQKKTFSTYGKMIVTNTYPSKGSKAQPLGQWTINFSNPIEMDDFSPDFVTVTPELKNMEVKAVGNYTIIISGRSKGKTHYFVKISEKLKDLYGQNFCDPNQIHFEVGEAPQTLQVFNNNRIMTIDPTDKKEDLSFSFLTTNLKKIRVAVMQVHPSEFHKSSFGADYYRWRQQWGKNYEEDLNKYINAGKKVYDEIIDVKSIEDEVIETKIDLKKFLQHPESMKGQLIIYAEPVKEEWKGDWKYRNRCKTWVQVTNLGLSSHTFNGGDNYSWVVDLSTGKSIEGANVCCVQKSEKFTTDYKDLSLSSKSDKDGLAFFSLKKLSSMAYAEYKDDIVFIRNISYHNSHQTGYLTYITSDRRLYKPNETVTLKGIIRNRSFERNQLKLEIPKKMKLKFRLSDSRGSKIKEDFFETNEFGSFVIKLQIPEKTNLGNAYFLITGKRINKSHYINIQEFRTPEFKSSTTISDGPFYTNGISIVTAKAQYYSGGGLNAADANWVVSQSTASYSPPNWESKGFSFNCNYLPLKDGKTFYPPSPKFIRFAGVTNGNGENKICVEFKENKESKIKKPVRISTACNIKDINRQTISTSSSFLVHPSKLYVGLKTKKHFANKGDTIPVDIVVTDIEGAPKAGKEVLLKVLRRKGETKGYSFVLKDELMNEVKFVTSSDPKEFSVKVKEGGDYFIIASVKDDEGKENYSSSSIWVSGGERIHNGGTINRSQVKLVANQKEYKVGETAKILVSSPFEGKNDALLVVFGSNGIISKRRLEIEETQLVDVKIERCMIPNCNVRVYMNGMDYRIGENGRVDKNEPKKPAYGFGDLVLEVPAEYHKINVDITPSKKIMSPGEEGKCKIKLSGTNVKNSVVSMCIVDEAVLNLANFSWVNPLSTFIQRSFPLALDVWSMNDVLVKSWKAVQIQNQKMRCKKPKGCFNSFSFQGEKRECFNEEEAFDDDDDDYSDECDEEEEAGCNESGHAKEPKKIIVRTNFCPLACFVQDKVTNEDGEIELDFKLPDNLTKYRVYVLATNGAEFFGLGETNLKAALPVSIRPSLPRFLNFGDKADCCVVLQNQTIGTVEVDVAVRMTNMKLTNNMYGLKVKIPFNKRAELTFPVETVKAGKARFQVVASVKGTEFSDSSEVSIPVYTPCTTEAFATYGEIDKDGEAIIQSILPPSDVFPQFGGFEIRTTSTALQSLTDAFLYLYNYEFDCVEQISSRMMSIFALGDILVSFNVPQIPTKKEMNNVVEKGLKKIRGVQKPDGAVGFWTIKSDVNVYLSVYIAHVLIRSFESGYTVNEINLTRSKSFCQNVDKFISQYSPKYGMETKVSLKAFALYVLTQFFVNKKLSDHECDKIVEQAEELMSKHEKFLTLEGKAWVGMSLVLCSKQKEKHPVVKKIMKEFMNNVNETAETANFITSYGDDGKLVMLHSDRRTDAVILDFLIHADKENKLIVKVVKGLLAHKKRGRWNSTQENIYILLALKKYFNTYEGVTPDFVAKMWLGDDYAGDSTFKGRETKTEIIKIPMNALLSDGKPEKKNLVLQKKGEGRMYYRLGMDYSPKNIDLKPKDYGFIVERTYEPVTNKEHVKYDKVKKMWVFKAGELIRTKLKLTNQSRRYHVALVDFIPSGCEVLNPELKGTESVPEEKSETKKNTWSYFWYRPWYNHHNLRNERVEVFSSYLYCGVHEFSYVMRATTRGFFISNPTKAEEMYSPDIFGRCGSEKVLIK